MEPVLKAFAWTLVHSLWQGLFAALFAAVIIAVTGRTTAKLRYNLLGIVFILLLSTVFFTFFITLSQQQILIVPDAASADATFNVTGNDSVTVVPVSMLTDVSDWFNDHTGLFLMIWVLLFLMQCLKLFTGMAAVQRLRTYKTRPVSEEWKIRLEELRQKLLIRSPVRFLQSELIKVPVALGFFKPVILLPLGLITHLPAEQVEAILLHELGHIRRRDYLVNFIQHFAEAIFFFNPALLWISSLLRQEREACCDDIVISSSGQKRNYLDALVNFQEYSLAPSGYAMSISSKKQYLLNRVKRMLTNENKRLSFFETSALIAGMLLFSAFTYMNNKQEVIDKPATGGQVAMIQSSIVPINDNGLLPAAKPVKKEMKIRIAARQPVTNQLVYINLKASSLLAEIKNNFHQLLPDSIPAKLLPGKKEEIKMTDAQKTLEEIIKMKEKMGVKKESIGKKKQQLEQSPEKDKDAILQQIEKEREDLQADRDELNRKRALYESFKKQEIKNKEREEVKGEKTELKFSITNKPELISKKKKFLREVPEQELKMKLQQKKDGGFLQKTKPSGIKTQPATPVRI